MGPYKLVLGVDPGFQGALAAIDLDLWWADVIDMPVIKDSKGRKDTNLPLLWKPFSDMAAQYPRMLCVIEDVSPMPKQGITSAFNFGENKGMLRAMAAAAGMEIRMVRPHLWKKAFGLSSDKGAARGLATERFPGMADQLSRVKDDGRAEALLLAIYGAEKLLPQIQAA